MKFSYNINIYIIINFFMSFAMGIFGMFAGIYVKELGFDESSVGMVLSVQTYAIAIFALVGAYLIGKAGSKRSFFIGSLAVGMGFLGFLSFESIFILIVFSAFIGFGFSIKAAGEADYLSQNSSPQNRVTVFSINFSVMNAGMMSASLLGGYLVDWVQESLTYLTSIRLVLGLAGLFIVVALGLNLMLRQKPVQPRNMKAYLLGYKRIIFQNQSALLFLIFNAVFGLGAGLIVPFFSVYLKYGQSITDSNVGTILFVAQLGTVLGGLVIPFLANHLGGHQTVLFCQALSIPFLYTITLPMGLIVTGIAFFMRSSLMNMANPLIQTQAMDLVEPLDRPNLSSLLSLFNNFFRATGIVIGGYLMNTYTYQTPYFFTIGLYILSIFLYTYIYKDIFYHKYHKSEFS